MKNILIIISVMLCTSLNSYSQLEIDLKFDYEDFLFADSTRDYKTIKFYDKKFRLNKESEFSLTEELIFNKDGGLIQRNYLCGTSIGCDTMRFQINECGESILIDDTFSEIIIPTSEIVIRWKNISIEYDNGKIGAIIKSTPDNNEELRIEYYYDDLGRIIEWRRFFNEELQLIRQIKYGT